MIFKYIRLNPINRTALVCIYKKGSEPNCSIQKDFGYNPLGILPSKSHLWKAGVRKNHQLSHTCLRL